MAQYINKDALVAEIERRRTKIKEYCLREVHDTRFDVVPEQLSFILAFIDTLEVKEVDLEKESESIANGIMISVQSNKYGTNIYNTERNDFNHYHLQMAARKGIELGLKAQKGE